jgi:hypothetical protein
MTSFKVVLLATVATGVSGAASVIPISDLARTAHDLTQNGCTSYL